MKLTYHLARAAKGARFPAQRIIDLVQLLRLSGEVAQNTADTAFLRFIENERMVKG